MASITKVHNRQRRVLLLRRTHHVSQSTMHWRREYPQCVLQRSYVRVALRQNDRAFPRQFRSEIISTEWMLEKEIIWQRNAWVHRSRIPMRTQGNLEANYLILNRCQKVRAFRRGTHGGRISNSPGSKGSTVLDFPRFQTINAYQRTFRIRILVLIGRKYPKGRRSSETPAHTVLC